MSTFWKISREVRVGRRLWNAGLREIFGNISDEKNTTVLDCLANCKVSFKATVCMFVMV